MAEQGTLAITARGDGNRWYGRISIPEVVAREAGLVAGVRVTARSCDGVIVISLDELGRIRFPAARGKSNPRHAFEAATATLGLKETAFSQVATNTEVAQGSVSITIPIEILAGETKAKRKQRKDPPKTRPRLRADNAPPVARTVTHGAAGALVTEATRAGKSVQPLSVDRAIQIIAEAGHCIERLGPRLFRLDGASASLPDIAELVGRISGSNEQHKVVIVLD